MSIGTEIAKRESGSLKRYNPNEGLKRIATAEIAERYWARAKDPTMLFKVVTAKLQAQAKYVVWRDSVTKRGGDGSNQHKTRAKIVVLQSLLPDADPGADIAHRWRESFCIKLNGKTAICKTKMAHSLADAKGRCLRVCERESKGTERGTAGTGEFLRYTPRWCIEAARKVLGEIDLDPASDETGQMTVRAKEYYTEEIDALTREWNGRIWLNPPYHRDLAPAFIDKLIAELEAGRLTAAIMLTNNSTDTEWFVRAHAACAAVCFTNGRIAFTNEMGNPVAATQGQVFFYFGEDVKRFADVFQSIGIGLSPLWNFKKVEKSNGRGRAS